MTTDPIPLASALAECAPVEPVLKVRSSNANAGKKGSRKARTNFWVQSSCPQISAKEVQVSLTAEVWEGRFHSDPVTRADYREEVAHEVVLAFRRTIPDFPYVSYDQLVLVEITAPKNRASSCSS